MNAIPTGSFWLDMALGGGWPVGRVSEIYGDAGAGTSTLALHTLAGVRGYCLYIDGINAFDAEYARRIGVDLNRVVVTSEPTAIEYFASPDTELIVIDGPPVPPRLIPPGQTVVLIGQGYASKAIGSVKVKMRSDGIWAGGQSVTLEVTQNDYAPLPTGWGSLFLHYGRGFSRAEEVLTLAFERHLITRRGSHYFMNEEHLGASWEKMVRAVTPVLLNDLESLLRKP